MGIAAAKSKLQPCCSVSTITPSNISAELPSHLLLNPREQQLVTETWTWLQEQIEPIGALTFQRLFEKYPSTLQTFLRQAIKTRKVDECGTNWSKENIKIHSQHVIALLDKVIQSLKNGDHQTQSQVRQYPFAK